MLERVVEIMAELIAHNVTPDKAADIASQIAQTELYTEQDRVRQAQYDSKVAVVGNEGVVDAI